MKGDCSGYTDTEEKKGAWLDGLVRQEEEKKELEERGYSSRNREGSSQR